MNKGAGASSEISARHKRSVFQCVKNAPTRKDIETWIREKEPNEEKVIKHEPAKDPSALDFDEEEASSMNVTVKIRVRQDSDDSLGSELSCSPPSSPDGATVEPTILSSDLFESPNNEGIIKDGNIGIKRKANEESEVSSRLKKRRVSWEDDVINSSKLVSLN